MNKFHINSKGEPGSCSATIKCPFGDFETEHFNSKEEARDFYENNNYYKNFDENSKPKWWSKYLEKNFLEKETFFKTFGNNKIKRILWNEYIAGMGYVELSLKDSEYKIIIKDSQEWSNSSKFHVWLYNKENKPITHLNFIAVKDFSKPSNYSEHIIGDIEVKEEYRGNKLGLKTIELVEENFLNGSKIHSSGSYTPLGYHALGGKLPYIKNPLNSEEEIKNGKIPKPSFNNMSFVHNWEELTLI